VASPRVPVEFLQWFLEHTVMSNPISSMALLAVLATHPASASPPVTNGEAQVRLMCAERPSLGRAIADHAALRAWLVDQLDGHSIGFPIAWDGAEPITGAFAEHEFSPGRTMAKVRVRSDALGLDQLSGLVFELQNIQGFATYEAAWQAGLRGEIGRQEFARRMAACEFEALTRTRTFLRAQLADLSIFELRDHPLTMHLLSTSPTLEQQVRKYRRLGYEVEGRFAAIFEQQIKPRQIVAN
jgi:hypothetical protein